MTHRLRLNLPVLDPELDILLARTKDYKMSPEEIKAQRRSWVKGELMLEHPEMTEVEADALIARLDP